MNIPKKQASQPILAAPESQPNFESDPRLADGSGRPKPKQKSGRIKYPRLEDDVVDKRGHEYYGLPKGFRDSALKNEITADAAGEDDLFEGETVVAQYDVYYPGKVIPMWLFVILSIFTLGIYALYYHCQNFCINKGWCTPSTVEVVRGRLMVTSMGRLLVWKVDFLQKGSKRKGSWFACGLDLMLMNWMCGKEPVSYGGITSTEAHLLNDVAEITMDTGKSPDFCCKVACCGEKFAGSIKIYFNKFDNSNSSATSTIKCHSISAYEALATAVFGESAGAYRAYRSNSNAAVTCLEVYTTRESDAMYDYEHKKSGDCFASLSEMYTALNGFMVAKRSRAYPWTPPSGPGFATKHLKTAGEAAHPWGSLNSVSETKVEIPTPWVSLAKGETVVASESNMYMMKCLDYVLSVLTCGLYFLCVLGAKRKTRPSLFLTSSRLLEVTPGVDDACLAFLPKAITDCCFPINRSLVVRSLYPQNVSSGIIRRLKFSVDVTICTDAGSISLSFNQIPVDSGIDYLKAGSKIAAKMAFAHALMSTATRQSMFTPAGEEEVLPPTKEEEVVFPMSEGEAILARFQGDVPDDSCTWLCGPLCTKKCTCYPGSCLCLTCGRSPMYSAGSIVLSTASTYVFKQRTNHPWDCWACLSPFVKTHDWQLLWTPLNHLVNTKVDTELIGDDQCMTRCCEGNAIGQNCCPLNKSVASVKITSKNSPMGDGVVSGKVGKLNMFKSLRIEPELAAFRKQVARVHARLASAPTTAERLPEAVVLGQPVPQSMEYNGSRF